MFGAGPAPAPLMLVGEQPSDREDRAGLPFVGPAGQLLRRLLVDVGIAPDSIYLTNVVKHFKWLPRGKRRIHERPNAREIAACRPWLDAELAVVRPNILLCLGATAAQALLGKSVRVSRQRGQLLQSPLANFVMVTVHPSSVLRAPTDADRLRETERLRDDLAKVATLL